MSLLTLAATGSTLESFLWKSLPRKVVDGVDLRQAQAGREVVHWKPHGVHFFVKKIVDYLVHLDKLVAFV